MELFIIILAFSLFTSLSICMVHVAAKPGLFRAEGHCVQKTAQTPAAGAKTVSAKVDGAWHEFPLVSFPQAFWDWNRGRRMEYLEVFREILKQGRDAARRPNLAGPHNGMVATYGEAREDSGFKLNNAIKGMGFVPKAEHLQALITLLTETMDGSLEERLNILEGLYAKAEEYFAPDRLVSLELYSKPGFTTQTFINQMLNPACATVFLDMPTFKIKQIARVLHPSDPELSPYEGQVVRYVNLIHSYFHGSFDQDFMAVLYLNTEIYDCSPGSSGGKGTRLMPAGPH
jgi:hypothetical protein